MKAPMPYFGGKAKVASEVWQRIGNTPNYCEPFFGSGAVFLARPDTHTWWEQTETVNDADGLLSNFWRAVKADPYSVARHADWPINENDLHARHAWLVGQKEQIQSALEGDPDFYDAKVAGWWLWGICLWIGSGWCSGDGPWGVEDGKLVHLGDAGQGINRQLVHLGNAGRGINRQRVHLGPGSVGTHRLLPDIAEDGSGHAEAWSEHLRATMQRLSDRLRRVRVCCGDWSRVCGPTPTEKLGVTGIFLDPPYSQQERESGLYRVEMEVATAVREWALERGDNPLYRIALCGYEGEHAMPGWTAYRWKAHGGYGSQGESVGRENSKRETIWFSPHCVKTDLFSWAEAL